MEFKTIKLKSHAYGFATDGYESVFVNPGQVASFRIEGARHMTYYIQKPCLTLRMANGETRQLFYDTVSEARGAAHMLSQKMK